MTDFYAENRLKGDRTINRARGNSGLNQDNSTGDDGKQLDSAYIL